MGKSSSSSKARAVPVRGARASGTPPRSGGLPLWVTLLLVGLLVAVGVSILVAVRSGGGGGGEGILGLSRDERTARLTATGGTVDQRTDEGSAHVASPTYAVDPPAGGDHLPAAAAARVYTAQALPPDGTVVHAMEHGYVVVWYRPDLRGEDLQVLRRVFDAYPRDTLLVPRSSLPPGTPVAATAWHQRLLLPTVAEQPLVDFVALYRNKGPEKVPH